MHLLGGSSATCDGGINGVSGFSEGLILGLELVNNTGGVDVGFISIPVNFGGTGVSDGNVIIVKDGLELRVDLTGMRRLRSSRQTSQPVVGQFVSYNIWHTVRTFIDQEMS